MTEENRSLPGLVGHDGQPSSNSMDRVRPDPVNSAITTSHHENDSREPSLGPAPPCRPSSPSPSPSPSSSSSAVDDDRTELQKFIQNFDSDEEDTDRLNTVLNGVEKDHVYQHSHYANDRNALHMAAERGMSWAVTRLLDRETVDVSILSDTDGDGRQPLHLACLEGHTSTAELLLQRGADIEAKQSFGATPLDEACWRGHKDVVELLLSENANTQVVDNNGWSPIQSAATYNRKDIVEMLLKKNSVNINAGDGNGETPLHAASGNGHPEVIRLLLENQADINKGDNDGETPLHAASRNGWDNAIRVLLENHADINKADNDGKTPLYAASQNGRNDAIRVLLENHADISTADNDGKTPLHTASQEGHVAVLELLLGHEIVNVNVTDNHRRTPVMVASQHGHAECVGRLCAAGADCNLQADEKEGENTALHYTFEPPEGEPKTLDEREKSQYEVVSELLKGKADPGILNQKKETALHLAARSGTLGTYEAIRTEMKGGQHRYKNQDEETALGSAVKTRTADILKWMTDESSAGKFDSDDEMDALLWVAQHEENHHHAVSLFENRKSRRHLAPPRNSGSEKWSAIEWAAYLEMPSVLWLLLATSKPLGTQKERLKELHAAKSRLDKAKGLLREKKGAEGTKPGNKPTQREAQAKVEGKGEKDEEQRGAEMETEKEGGLGTTDKQNIRSTRQDAKDLVWEILQDPPPTITSAEKETLKKPTAGEDQEKFLLKLDSKAAVIDCSVKNDKPRLFTQFHEVREVIYGTGPKKIAKKRAETVEKLKKLNGSTIYQKICKLQEERLGDSLYTWVHIPATNITWMNDLLKRILMEDPSSLDDPQCQPGLSSEDEKSNKASQANSFFKASWSEIPDKTSESRIMKPVYTTETMRQETKHTKKGEKTDEPSVDSPERFLHAIYIPYLTFSRQGRSEDLDKNDQGGRKQPQKKEMEGQKEGKEGKGKDGRNQKEDDLQTAYKAYHNLLQCYKSDIIHGSATLDESFYHFSKAQHDDQETAAQREDRQRRNETQVVTKHIHGDGPAEKSYWTIVRTNQLWVWIIRNKWLITATTHPIDEVEDPFLTDLLDYIKTRARAEGREVWSRSPLEMAKTIVEYCIDSYDRRPKSKVYGTDHSIRQIFSDSINKIAREDARLFEDFCERIGAKQPKKEDKDGEESRGFEEQGEAPKEGGKANTNERIEEAIKAAARLSAEIRDIRDELQMLQAIAKHQMRVQKKLKNESSADAELWGSYVMSDIGDMIRSADRIKSNVEMTLSLEQSQIANNQAKESVEQGVVARDQADVAIEHAQESVRQGAVARDQADVANNQAKESFQQGQTLMVFTAITAFFLPSSFLSSLFALDVDSFRKAPYWVFIIIFLVSAALSLPLLYVLWRRELYRRRHPVGSLKNGAGSSKDGEKGRNESTGPCESKEEDWHTMCGGLVEWRRRRRENSSKV